MSTDLRDRILVNGEPREVVPGSTVADVLRALDLDPAEARGVAVAVNDEVVRRGAWAERRLHPDDRVEVLTARQGG